MVGQSLFLDLNLENKSIPMARSNNPKINKEWLKFQVENRD
jgi:hypothetical protein